MEVSFKEWAPKPRVVRPVRTAEPVTSESLSDKLPRRTTRVKPNPSKIKSVLAGTIVLSDLAAFSLAPQVWTQDDRISKKETAMLVNAVYDELSSYPKLIAYIAKMADMGKHGALIWAITVISIPRLIRHGLIPAETNVITLLMGPGGASSDSGGYGNGEVNFSELFADVQASMGRTQVES